MSEDQVARNLQGMDNVDFIGWNNGDWHGTFSDYHTDDVVVEVKGMDTTQGLSAHIEAMDSLVKATTGETPNQVVSHPIAFGSGEWTCVVGEFENGERMVTVARWRDGKIAEEYIWL
ncbi:nuclear transport factor 2 family protein [Rhodococcus wratislaviensis]|uniref:hypothetical protein n=1 Tax=Rhodococcus wratislaviensis TaxID=44752 RepID=UPI0036672E09